MDYVVKKYNYTKKTGRPTIFTPELGKLICDRIAKGESLRKICRDYDDVPEAATVHTWILDTNKKEFHEQYVEARRIQSELMFEEIEELSDASKDDIVGNDKSDNARVSARKLQVDTRKWILARMRPKKFGDKMDVTTGGEKLPAPIYGGQSVRTIKKD